MIKNKDDVVEGDYSYLEPNNIINNHVFHFWTCGRQGHFLTICCTCDVCLGDVSKPLDGHQICVQCMEDVAKDFLTHKIKSRIVESTTLEKIDRFIDDELLLLDRKSLEESNILAICFEVLNFAMLQRLIGLFGFKKTDINRVKVLCIEHEMEQHKCMSPDRRRIMFNSLFDKYDHPFIYKK